MGGGRVGLGEVGIGSSTISGLFWFVRHVFSLCNSDWSQMCLSLSVLASQAGVNPSLSPVLYTGGCAMPVCVVQRMFYEGGSVGQAVKGGGRG